MPDNTETPRLSPKFALALQFANEIHSTQLRKGLGAPYISHLMAVCSYVLEYGGSETQAIAALLHDVVEDCGGMPILDTVRVIFGKDVADIVEACTDSFDVGSKSEWRPRKEAYLNTMAGKPGEAKLVACADKLHNLSNTLRDINQKGVEPWKARMVETKNGAADKQCWYYLGCLEALSKGWASPMLGSFERAVLQLCERVGTPEDVALARKLGRRVAS